MNPPPAETITPPNPLEKAKTGDGPVKIDPNILRQAEQAVEELQDDYAGWAQKDIDGLSEALAQCSGRP